MNDVNQVKDLSVIIPAKNEKYLENTIKDVLKNIRANTEILVVLDGYVPDPQIIINDDRVKFICLEKSVGQRGAINCAAKISTAKFIMKLDAHCMVDEGFDVKLMKDCEYDWTVVPTMYNLDVEKWEPKWYKKPVNYMYISSPNAEKPFRAQYYEGKTKDNYQRQPVNDKMIDDTMCIMGPCYFMHRERFWELGGEDEGHGGWGQQGIEKALKAWISGGRMVVNKNTWFAHWWRGGIGFPYSLGENKVEKARRYSQDLWLNDKWPLAKRKLQWVIDKFDPPGWNTILPKGKWYQEATINGRKMPTLRRKDTNEKRWKQYIEPLVEKGIGTFLDLGCNAGFYCRKMIDLGYTATGVEYDPIYIGHANYWEENDPKGTKIIQEDVNNYNMEKTDIALLANFHYWLTKEQLQNLEFKLRNNVDRVIIVGRYDYNEAHKSDPNYDALINIFSNWKVVEHIKGKKYYSVLLQNDSKDIEYVNTEEFFKNQHCSNSKRFYPSFKKLIETGNEEEYRNYLEWRGFNNISKIIGMHKELIESIRKEGIKNPLLVQDGRLKDGDHRIIIAKVLGIEKVPVMKYDGKDFKNEWREIAKSPEVKKNGNRLSTYSKAIIYYTNNIIEPELCEICQKQLLKAAGDIPIISISQKPINFGYNICVGDIGSSHLSLFKQIREGLLVTEADVIIFAEHDCLYTEEHINWNPPDLDIFYYNNNQWFLQYNGKNEGLFSHMRRRVLSQLIAGREIMLKAVEEKIEFLENGYTLVKGAPGACEPGCMDDKAFVKPIGKDLGKDPSKWRAERFSTKLPNIDIRHSDNFSGGRIAKQRATELPYWGTLEDIKKIGKG